MTTRVKQVQIKEEEDSVSQELLHQSSRREHSQIPEEQDFDTEIGKKVELIDQLKKTYVRFEEEEEQLKEQNPMTIKMAAKQAYASGGGLSSKFSSNMSAGIEKTKVKIRLQI